MSSPLMRRRLLAAVAAAGLLSGAAVAVQAPATAASPGTPTKTETTTATHTITLITGDVVTVRGSETVDVERPDGAPGGVRLQRSGGDLFVLPDEVLPLLSADRLDRRLFNVTDLLEMGYDDAKTGVVPVISTVPAGAARTAAPAVPRGAKLVRDLRTVGAAALTVDKSQTRPFWTALGEKPGKLWLDGKVTANLADSVPQIGAPEAWAAGYDGSGVKVAVLDTGIDATHPDLVDQIDDKVSFVPDQDTSDVNGHGTHVASTIVGTGAASSGVNKGVAPGADLIVGKVLDDSGSGLDSWVLAGMQWAAESGADIVSMSLSDPTLSDGTDPMAVAVDTLSARYGTLFVIASGNSGPETIGTPSSAASALTVGAVDKQDNLAYFSSTGPLIRSGALKPDITAPGVDINAARSQQMTSGSGLYRSISGTSMATPHVSGAAAILAQRHPGWTGPQLKEALMSSAKALPDYTPYEVGTGRVDVAAAVDGQVRATGSVFFGNFDWPHEPTDEPVTKQVTFTNTGTTGVTLNLAATGPFELGGTSVTVPAGGTATVPVSGDPTKPGTGRYTGYLVGTDAASGAAVTRTSLGLIKEDERYDLSVKLIGRDGRPATANVVIKQEGEYYPYVLTVTGEQTLRMPPGTYTVESFLEGRGERADSLGYAILVDPETVLDGKSATVVLDASKARLLDTTTPQRTENRQRKVDYTVTYPSGDSFRDAFLIPTRFDDVYVSPTEQVEDVTFTMVNRWRKGEPLLTVSALGLPPLDVTVQPGSTLDAGRDVLPLVYAGTGAPGEYPDTKGKAVVVTRSDAISAVDRAAAAVAAGAKLLLVVNDGVGTLNEVVGDSPIPVATVHRDAGARLIDLARSGRRHIAAHQVPYATYLYDLTRTYTGKVPNRPLTYHPRATDLARIDARYLNPTEPVEGSGGRYDVTFLPGLGFPEREWHPSTRTEWVTPGQDWAEVHAQGTWTVSTNRHAYAKGATRLDWFAPAIRPAFSRTFAVQNSRYQDYMTINVQAWTPSGDTLEYGGNLEWGSVPTNLKLYQGGKLLHENTLSSSLQWKEVPSGTLPYHLVLDASRPAEQWRLSTRTHTEWDFVSSSNDSDNFEPMALLQMEYRLDTDLHGDLRAGGTQKIRVKPIPQAGGGPGTGTVTSVGLEVSYDDGATWQRAALRKDGGWWASTLKLPRRPGGFLSVRASGATDAGFSINQEIIRAYGLR
ncbi:subtilisin family serine protease [Actinoplanes campanulatus]|uniref:Subtilisin family serine protease n=1 Tax=Actinoplanes campanulatus TaxID=113559 RepID=A0A7W5AG02_9ACTN|nr:S8 family serine peptidase [Actinoplanes campanulatus]MBB3095626.1 subtilisin family serine protease [Actinoplanes campanulatus]GGN10368.1 peptidase [Actinoplanes campanulatus]GID36520.1 peptidase [Actinoplanes campanulatus]